MNYEDLKNAIPALAKKVEQGHAEAQAKREAAAAKKKARYKTLLEEALNTWGISAEGIFWDEKKEDWYAQFGPYRLYTYGGGFAAYLHIRDTQWQWIEIKTLNHISSPNGLTTEGKLQWHLNDKLSRLSKDVQEKLTAPEPETEPEKPTPLSYEAIQVKELKNEKLVQQERNEENIKWLRDGLDKMNLAYDPAMIQLTEKSAFIPYGPVEIVYGSDYMSSWYVRYRFERNDGKQVEESTPLNKHGGFRADLTTESLWHCIQSLQKRAQAIIEGTTYEDNDWTQRSIQSLFAELCERVGVDFYED